MAVREYIGARYVPLFADPIDWDSNKTYEPLTVVYYSGNSFTSRQYVPAGIDINNETYWAKTGNYNAQIEQYRAEVQSFDERITANSDVIQQYGQELANEIENRSNADNALNGRVEMNEESISIISRNNWVNSDRIADSAVTESKIADSAVTKSKIADRAVTESKIADSAVTESKIADSAVTESKIADSAVTESKIADSAVTESKIADSVFEIIDKKAIPSHIDFMQPIYRQEMTGGANVNGGCLYRYNGNLYYIFAIIARNETSATIYIVDEQGNITAQHTTTQVGHAQNMAVKGNKLYIANTKLVNQQNEGDTGFAIFDITPNSIAYSNYLPCPEVDYVFEFTIAGDYIYMRNRSNLDKRNLSDLQLVKTTTLNNLQLVNFGNGFAAFEKCNLLGIVALAGNYISLVDMETLNPIKRIQIAKSYGYIDMFELEWVAFEDEDIYIGVNSGYNYNVNNVSDISVFTVMKTNIFAQYGFPSETNANIIADESISETVSVHIDYVNGEKIPEFTVSNFSPNIVLKYPQDVKGLIRTLGYNQTYTATLDSDCPICIKIEGANFNVNISGHKVKGIFLHGCTTAIADSAGTKTQTTDASYWITNSYLVQLTRCPYAYVSLYWVLSGATYEYNISYTFLVIANNSINNIVNPTHTGSVIQQAS